MDKAVQEKSGVMVTNTGQDMAYGHHIFYLLKAKT